MKLKLLFLFLFLSLSIFFINKDFAFSNSPDAFSIRIIPNPEHYAIIRWYKSQGFTGSPQSLTVDGYDAIRVGRTVYVNAGNIVNNRLYTNIYMISYNQDAESETEDIFGKIIANWKFNTNITSNGFCSGDYLEVFYDAEDGQTLSPSTPIMADGSNNVYHRVNSGHAFSSDFLPVDTLKTYKISGDFKSASSSLSRLYFGIAVYDRDFNSISSYYVLRNGNDATVLNFTPTTITVNTPLTGWRDNGSYAGERSLGFYYLGNITRPPQYVRYWYEGDCEPAIMADPFRTCYYSMWPDRGAYNGAGINGSTVINLNTPLPTSVTSAIIPGVTKIMNHYSGGSYNYSAASNASVPNSWTEYREDDLTGEGFGGNPDMFRPGTRYIKILLLLNHRQYAGEEIYFDNIHLIEDGIEPKYQNNVPVACNVDDQCQKENLGYCVGPKSEIRRDVKRLADLADMNTALENYQKEKGRYPTLSSGSYLPNKTISTWPSWQKELGKELKINMPVDPLNELGDCTVPSGYNPDTCWNETTKKFAANLDNLELPNTSHAYIYKASENGKNYDLCSFTESGYVLEFGGNCESTGGTISSVVTNANQPPRFTSNNIPVVPKGEKLEGFIEAIDPDGDQLTWTIDTAPGNPWAGWSAVPVLKSSAAENQRIVSADMAGNDNTYNFNVTINDGKGGIVTQSFQIKVVDFCGNGIVDLGEECDPNETKAHFESRTGKTFNAFNWATLSSACTANCTKLCADADGDGHGLCPNCGTPLCASSGNDCDDRPNGADGIAGNRDDGGNINPSAPDNCQNYDGIDNNCNGSVDEGASLDNIITNVDFEDGPIGGYPVNWIGNPYYHVTIGISDQEAYSGNQSVLLHRDPGLPYPGTCTQAICEHPVMAGSYGCNWVIGTPNRCEFSSPDNCHPSGPASYDEGETLCSGNTFRVMWGSLNYDVSSLPFSVGDSYIVQFYYKGNSYFNNSLSTSFSYTPGWPSQVYDLVSQPWRVCHGANSGWADHCVSNSNYCCLHALSSANQEAPYTSKTMSSVADGNYADWTYYADSFDYTSDLALLKTDSGNIRHIYALRFGYGNTGPGADLFIDDFKLIKCYD